MLRIIFLSLLLSSVSAVADTKTTDFDLVCGFYTELSQTPKINKMSPEQKTEFVGTRIAVQLNEGSDAKIAWVAIKSAPSEQRYELFKSAAESILPKTWNCPTMQKYAPTTGD